MTSPALAQELVDEIIDIIHYSHNPDEPNGSLTLSLVCKSFSQRCRNHLFAKVALNLQVPYDDTKPIIHEKGNLRFLELLEADPGIAPLVRRLQLHFKPTFHGIPGPDSTGTDTYFSTLVQLLPNVQSVHFSNDGAPIRWTRFSGSMHSALHHLCSRPSVEALRLAGLSQCSVAVITNCPNLKHLDLFVVSPAHSEVAVQGEVSRHLVSLHVNGSFSFVAKLLELDTRPLALSRIRKLKATVSRDDEYAVLWDIIERASFSLESVELSWMRRKSSGPTIVQQLSALSRLPSLKDVRFSVTMGINDRWAFHDPAIREVVDSPGAFDALEVVRLNIQFILADLKDPSVALSSEGKWGVLDDLFSSSRLPSLKAVYILISINPAGQDWKGQPGRAGLLSMFPKLSFVEGVHLDITIED